MLRLTWSGGERRSITCLSRPPSGGLVTWKLARLFRTLGGGVNNMSLPLRTRGEAGGDKCIDDGRLSKLEPCRTNVSGLNG